MDQGSSAFICAICVIPLHGTGPADSRPASEPYSSVVSVVPSHSSAPSAPQRFPALLCARSLSRRRRDALCGSLAFLRALFSSAVPCITLCPELVPTKEGCPLWFPAFLRALCSSAVPCISLCPLCPLRFPAFLRALCSSAVPCISLCPLCLCGSPHSTRPSASSADRTRSRAQRALPMIRIIRGRLILRLPSRPQWPS